MSKTKNVPPRPSVGMTMTSLARTFQDALELLSWSCTYFICGWPRKSRGWLKSAHGTTTASSHGWFLRYWRWSMTIRSTVLPNFSVRYWRLGAVGDAYAGIELKYAL